MHNLKLVSTPTPPSTKLTSLDGPSFEDPHLYHSVVGSLKYLSFTQPDVSFFMNKVYQFMHCHKLSHWQAVKQIQRYLRHTTNFAFHFSPTLIGPIALMSKNLSMAFVYFLVLNYFLGVLKIYVFLLVHLLNLNKNQLPILLVRYYGYNHC